MTDENILSTGKEELSFSSKQTKRCWIVIVIAITSINCSTTRSPLDIVLTDAKLIEKLRDELERDENAMKLDRKRLDDNKEITTPIHSTDLIELNVGGEMIATTRQTMTKIPQSILFNLFNGRWEHRLPIDNEGNIRFDFDPILFRHLLDQLQTFDANKFQKFLPPSQPTSLTWIQHPLPKNFLSIKCLPT